MPSKAQIWERSRSRSSNAALRSIVARAMIGAADLACNPVDGKEGAEDRLFPVKIKGVAAGKYRRNLLPQLGPASGRRTGAEAVQHRVRFRAGSGGRITAGRVDGDLAKQVRQEFLDGT